MKEEHQGMTKKQAMDILGLKSNFTERDLIDNYRKQIKVNHPDRGGSDEKSKNINVARAVLKKELNLSNKGNSTPTSTSTPVYKKEDYKNVSSKIEELKRRFSYEDKLADEIPKWVRDIKENIDFDIDNIDIDPFFNRNGNVGGKINLKSKSYISELRKIEDVYCKYTGISKDILIKNGYIPIADNSDCYNINDIYGRLLEATSKIFKENISGKLHKCADIYGSFKKEIDNKIGDLTRELSTKKLDDLITDFSNFLSNLYQNYQQDNNLLSTLKNNYLDLLEPFSIEISKLYTLCGRSEFETFYNDLEERLKVARKEQKSTILVYSLNQKYGSLLSSISSLKGTIKINKLYSKLLDVIYVKDLSPDITSLIINISPDNFEMDINNILRIFDIKIKGIYVPKYRTDLPVPLYVSCQLDDKEYFIKVIYQNGISQVEGEVYYDTNDQISLEEILKSLYFKGGTKTSNINDNNSVLYQYMDFYHNNLGVVKNNITNTIEVCGSREYISHLNDKPQDEELKKYQDINEVIKELTNELAPCIERYLYESIIKSNGRSK